MSRVGFLRRQAEFFLRSSQSCPDSQEAGKLRLVAAEYFRMATEAERAESAEGTSQPP
jgi:hypothetical protein